MRVWIGLQNSVFMVDVEESKRGGDLCVFSQA